MSTLYAHTQLPLARPTFTRPPASYIHGKPARALQPRLFAICLFLFLAYTTILALQPLLLGHPALRQHPTSQGRTLPVLGNWRHIPQLTSPETPTRVIVLPFPSGSNSASEESTLSPGRNTERAEDPLFLAPDALEQEPDLTLQELEEWVKAYVVPPSSPVKEKKPKVQGQKRARGRRGAALKTNQD